MGHMTAQVLNCLHFYLQSCSGTALGETECFFDVHKQLQKRTKPDMVALTLQADLERPQKIERMCLSTTLGLTLAQLKQHCVATATLKGRKRISFLAQVERSLFFVE